MQINLNLSMVGNELAKWDCPKWLSSLVFSYSEHDERKWRLVLRLAWRGRLSKSATYSIMRRAPRPPVKKALILKKTGEIICLYEDLSFLSDLVSQGESESGSEKYSGLLEDLAKANQNFEKSCFELTTLDPDVNILSLLKSRLPYLFDSRI